MLSALNKRLFRRELLAWYDREARALPWRTNHDPYRVWVSEIMLQQTRVAAVIEHYHAFLKKFPTVHRLANARESSVLTAWSGLGYYRRARMMHRAAKEIVSKHDGKFPETAAGLRDLPGIGRYTAAAIASIAFGEPVAVVDGNVERVLSRLAGENLQHADVWPLAADVMDAKRPGDFNQAMMELGATMCLPRQPKCLMCPVNEFCRTRGEMPPSAPSKPQQKKEVHYALDWRDDAVRLVERAKHESLMPRMWELPEIEGNGVDASWMTLRHSITATDYTVRVKRGPVEDRRAKWVARNRLLALPLTGLTRKILKRAGVI